MRVYRLVSTLGIALSCVVAFAPVESHAQFGGYGGLAGGIIGGAIAGSIIANSQPRTVYVRPRVVYARSRVVHTKTRVVYAAPARHVAPHSVASRSVVPAATPTSTINANADPFATAKPGSLTPIANKP